MKTTTQTFFIAILLTLFVSCKNESKNTTVVNEDELEFLVGEYVYHNGAAVLQTNNEIYGVLITDKTEELNTQAKKYKKEPTDMVEVEIKAKVTNQKDEKILWENKVEIVEILNVKSAPKEKNNTIKLGQE